MRTLASIWAVAALLHGTGSRVASRNPRQLQRQRNLRVLRIGSAGNFNGGTQVKVFSAHLDVQGAGNVGHPAFAVTGLFTDTRSQRPSPARRPTSESGLRDVDGKSDGILPSSCVGVR